VATNKRKPVRPVREGPKRAAVYVRVSTEEQAQAGATSVDDQERQCRQYAESKGWRIVAVFRDEGASGTTEDRPAWNEFMAAARAGEVDVVVLTKWNRFARRTRVGLQITEQLEELGVYTAIVEMDLDCTTSAGRYMRTQMLAFAEMQRDDLVGQMAAGAHAKARDGRWPSSPQGAPFGLRVEGAKREARLVLHEQEAETIRTAARLILDEGRTLAETCTLLNSLGMLPRGGLRKLDGQTVPIPAAWGLHLLRRHLTRPALVGEVYWGTGRTSTGNYGGVQIRDVPAVLTRERWEALREAITVHGPAPEYGMAYPLSGRVVSLCGKRYNGIYRSDRDLRSYKCQGKRGEHGIPACGCPWYDAGPLEARVWGVWSASCWATPTG
jgi:site-specific DNA recombinase